MTTNQTIDGVPRELALRLLLGNGSELARARKELRALLDAESTPCAKSQVEPAAQAQGEPVAQTMKSVMSAICSIDGFPMLTSNQCHALAAKLNAEQPAPVAVASLEIVGRQCFPSETMKKMHGYRTEPWVDGNIHESPSTPGLYTVEPLVRLADVARLNAKT